MEMNSHQRWKWMNQRGPWWMSNNVSSPSIRTLRSTSEWWMPFNRARTSADLSLQTPFHLKHSSRGCMSGTCCGFATTRTFFATQQLPSPGWRRSEYFFPLLLCTARNPQAHRCVFQHHNFFLESSASEVIRSHKKSSSFSGGIYIIRSHQRASLSGEMKTCGRYHSAEDETRSVLLRASGETSPSYSSSLSCCYFPHRQ